MWKSGRRWRCQPIFGTHFSLSDQKFGHISSVIGFASQCFGASFACMTFFLERSPPKWGEQSPISFRTVLVEHWKYSRWAVLSTVVFWFSGEAYCVLIGMLLGSANAAGFRAVQNLCMMLPNLVTALSVLLLPHAARTYVEHGPRNLHTLVTWSWLSGFSRLMPFLICNLLLITVSQGIQTEVRAFNRPQYIFHAFLSLVLPRVRLV
jgi:O-antigen/teichoic acid export membrane protein